jgi:hypothetical protein
MDFRKDSGEQVTGKSWVMRDLWNTRISSRRRGTVGIANRPVRLKSSGLKRLMKDALWSKGIRKRLEPGKRRHEFQADHGYRKWFKTQCELAGIGDWLYNIKQQKEEDRFYKLMELSYKIGLGKIYTEQEIEQQKRSLSFAREYNLSFESGIDGLFNSNDIDQCIADKYDPTFHNGLTCWAGIDPGYSTSKFGIVVIAWANGKIQVMKELEVVHADPDLMRYELHKIVQQYSICRLFIDSSSIYLIRQLCKDYGVSDVTMYDDKAKDQLLLTSGCGGPSLIQSVNFRTKHKLMLEQLHKVVSTQQIRIDPKFKGIISALRTATTKQFGEVYDLDKKGTSSNDLLDAIRLSLLCLSSS